MEKGKTVLRWIIGVVIVLSVLGGCGLITNLWWQSLGTVAHQAILGLLGVGFVYYCILPIVGVVIAIGLYIAAMEILRRW